LLDCDGSILDSLEFLKQNDAQLKNMRKF